MKKILISISLTIITIHSFAQMDWGTDFDPPYFQQYFSDRFYVDTVTNPNCKWQIGQPFKTVFDAAYSNPNALMTDTLNPLPANDTSIIYVKHYRWNMQPFHVFILHFLFKMDGDPTDRGIIEISPDTGKTWINLLTQDTTYQMYWQSSKPTLTGSTTGWQSFDLDMMQWASANSNFPILMSADTILFRFTYITGANSIGRDGWLIDNLSFEDWYDGVQEIQNENLISISPNPASEKIQILRKVSTNERIQVINYTGQILIDKSNFVDDVISTQELSNGIYLLKYSDTKNISLKKFIVHH